MVDLDNVQIRYSLRLMTLLAYDVIFVNVCKKKRPPHRTQPYSHHNSTTDRIFNIRQ